MSLKPGGHHPTISQKVRFQGNSSPAAPTGLAGGGVTGIAATIAKFTLGEKEAVQKFFLNTAKEGPMAIVPLETSVLVGRSERAYRRDGWLELQERLTEEMAAAVVWLFGVGYLQNKFETVSNKFQKGKNQHLSTNIAWNKPWEKVTHVDLTPQEMFAKNDKEISALLRLKSARWLFSVGTALALVGYFIPKGNQLKTNMILKHLERRKRASEGSNVQFGDPNRQNQPNGSQQRAPGQVLMPPPPALAPSRSLMPHLPVTVGSLMPGFHSPASGFPPVFPSGSSAKGATTGADQPGNTAIPFHSALSTQFSGQGQNPAQNQPMTAPAKHGPNGGVRFGAGMPGLSIVQAIGSSVEQTNYGQLLAVDFGIAGGRGYVASKRSPYETAEVLFRDIVSLYFYILCAPHLMKAITTGMDKAFNSSSHLQPKVAKLLHDQIEERINQGESIDRIIYGLSDGQMGPEGPLKKAMRAIKKDDLTQLITKEARVYLGDQALTGKINDAIHAYLKPSELAQRTKNEAELNPSYVQHLLEAIEAGNGAFGELSASQRQNLGIAVKQATRHTVGMKIDLKNIQGTDDNPSLFKGLIQELRGDKNLKIKAEAGKLEERITRIATLESMDQTHSMMRRSANVLREKLTSPTDMELLQRGDALANWIDKAMHHSETIKEHMATNLAELGEKLHDLKLEGEPLQRVRQALGGKSLNTPDEFKIALSDAETSHLRDLADTFGKMHEEAKKSASMWPFNAQSRKMKSISESLANLKLRLGNSTEAKPAEALKDSITSFMDTLKNHSAANEAERNLLTHYQGEVNRIVKHDEGRFFSLAIRHEDGALSNKLREILRGGLVSDSKLVSRALDTMGQLETDTRKMPSTSNEAKMRKELSAYTEALYKRFNPANTGQDLAPAVIRKELPKQLGKYLSLNRNLHYLARGASLGTAMACIGWLVPIVQTKITKHLTGMDNNPGIASAKKLMDDEEASEAKGAGSQAKPSRPPGFSANSAGPRNAAAQPVTASRPAYLPPAGNVMRPAQMKAQTAQPVLS